MPSYPGGVGLVFGLPHDGKRPVPLSWAFSFHQLSPPMDYDLRMQLVQGKPVDEARNDIAKFALECNAKYLFFLDTDVTVPPHTIRQLIFHLDHWDKYAVAGGIYCHKSPPQAPMVFRGNGIGPYWDWKIGEVFDVSGIGMGATLIRVDILRHLEYPYFRTVDNPDRMLDGENHYEMWTEDLYFCNKVRNTCVNCNKNVSAHKNFEPVKGVGHEQRDWSKLLCPDSLNEGQHFSPWGVLADGGLLGQHWDVNSNVGYSLPAGSKPFQRTRIGGKKVVDLGCGPVEDSYRTDEGTVLRVDIRDDVKPDFRCDIRNTPFANNEFDVVFSSHTLEHFCRQDSLAVVKEMTRILKPEGELRLVLPNLAWAAQHVVNDEVDIDVMNVLYGGQNYKENFHMMGYTPKMLEQLLRQNGFVKFEWDYAGYHMMVRAWRDANAEVQLLNPVFTYKRIETQKLVEQAETDPNIKVKDGSITILTASEGQFEGQNSFVGADVSASDGASPAANAD